MEGKIEVIDLIGGGGFANVYLVKSKEFQSTLAVKTYKEEYFDNPEVRTRFIKEAKIWMDIGAHPNIVRIFYVDSKSRRMYIGMECIFSNQDTPNTLEGYLRLKQITLDQSIRWAIQFCHGMEYAYSKGLKAHRDIKPSNIMIDVNKTVKISDFGLSSALNPINSNKNIGDEREKNDLTRQSFSTKQGDCFGTPPYMSPEQFVDFSHCDVRSDIYSFGIVLFQLCNDGNVPFSLENVEEGSCGFQEEPWKKMQDLHTNAPIPKFDSLLQPIVKKCLEKNPDNRYQSFIELREDLEQIFFIITGEKLLAPNPSVYTIGDLINRGNSYSRMGFLNEAIECYNIVLAINPNQTDAINGKAVCLSKQGFDKEAIILFNNAIILAPNDPMFLLNRGNYYFKREQYPQALSDYQNSIKRDSTDSFVWSNIGTCLLHMEKFNDSLFYFDKALEIEADLVETIGNKGVALLKLDRYEDALKCFDKALKLDPIFTQIWHNKGLCHSALKDNDTAIQCFDRAIEIDNNFWLSYQSKSIALRELGRYDDADECQVQAQNVIKRK